MMTITNTQQIEPPPTGEVWVLIWFVFAAIVLISLILLGVWLWHRFGHKTIKGEVFPQPDPAVESMDRLTRLLASIEPNTTEAEARLRDARIATDSLMRQVLAVVKRVEELGRQAGHVRDATDAIRTGERAAVAYVAGKIQDDSLRTLLLSPYVITRPDFQAEAFILLANEQGSLEECAAGYGRLTTALVGQLAQARTRVIGLEQQVQMLEATHPILLIEQGLNKSIEALNLRAQPALRWTAKQALPAGVQRYLRG